MYVFESFFSCFQIEEKIKMLPGQCCTFLFKVNEIVPNGVCCHIKFIDERSRKWCSCLVIIVVSWVTNAQKTQYMVSSDRILKTPEGHQM